jgi:release factor glutamine methyltransferase
LSVLHELPEAAGLGMDVSPAALAVAEDNARALGLAARTQLVVGDWRRPGWADRLDGPFDFVLANPPYIETATIDGLMPEVARFEPRAALDGGPDGLAAYRAIALAAANLVTSGGHVLVEASEGQATEIIGIFAKAGLKALAPLERPSGDRKSRRAEH